MTPATHVVVAAAAASRMPGWAVALGVSFASHFALDFVYHFEAFYPLSVPGGWRYDAAMLAALGALAAVAGPAAMWLLRRDREARRFAVYALLLCLLPFEPAPRWRLAWVALAAAAWWALHPDARVRRWTACGFAAYLPDALRHWSPAVQRIHDWFHYRGALSLGDWVSLLGQGRWQLHGNAQIYDPYYQAGFALEILLEGAILLGALYVLRRRP